MQRAKHADRRQDTRRRLELGDAVVAAGADHLSPKEITEILSSHALTSHDKAEDRDESGDVPQTKDRHV